MLVFSWLHLYNNKKEIRKKADKDQIIRNPAWVHACIYVHVVDIKVYIILCIVSLIALRLIAFGP